MLLQTPLEMYRATDTIFDLVVKLNGTVLNLTGCALHFMAKWINTDTNASALISLTSPDFAITSAINGEATLTIPAASTSPLPNQKLSIPYNIWLIDAGAKRRLLLSGTLTIHPTVPDFTP